MDLKAMSNKLIHYTITSPMIIHKNYPFYRLQLVLETYKDTQLNEQNFIEVSKVGTATNKKTVRNSQISLTSPISIIRERGVSDSLQTIRGKVPVFSKNYSLKY